MNHEWMDVKRVEGEPGGIGVFEIEDHNLIQWRVKVVKPLTPNRRGVSFRHPVCWSADYEPGDSLYDIWEACKVFFDEQEGGAK